MGGIVETLTPNQIAQAQGQANAIANVITPTTIGSNTFIFFAAFDGTDNGDDPALDGSGDTQVTAVNQLYNQVYANTVKTGNVQTGNIQAKYYPGVGTPDTLPGSDFEPNAVTQQSANTAQDAYDDFAEQAYNWVYGNSQLGIQPHPDASLTSMITGFSRGDAAAAIFSQMLYENGLVYNGVTLIPPGQTGSASPITAALIIDPVLTGENGNMDFPPNVDNLTVVQAQNEYRSLFPEANYGNPAATGATILPVMGDHGDAGDLYSAADGGTGYSPDVTSPLGGIYLDAYTRFFGNAGLNISPVPADLAYNPNSSIPAVIHSEVGSASYDYSLYNPNNYLIDPNTGQPVPRQDADVGAPVGPTQNGEGTEFINGNNDIVLGGIGGGTTQGGEITNIQGSDITDTIQNFVVLPNSEVTISSASDNIYVNEGATLNFNSTANLDQNVVTLEKNATLNLSGANTKVYVNDSAGVAINLAPGASVAIPGNNNTSSIITNATPYQVALDGTGNILDINDGSAPASDTQGMVQDDTIDSEGDSTITDYGWNGPTITQQFQVAFNAEAQSTEAEASSGTDYTRFQNTVANALAAQVIAKFLFQNNLPASAVAKALSNAAINTLLPTSTTTGVKGFLENFGVSLASIVGNLAITPIADDLFKDLGLSSQLSNIAADVASGALFSQQTINNLIDDINQECTSVSTSSFVDPADLINIGASAIGNYLGSELSNLVIGTQTEASTLGGALGGALGAYAGTAATATGGAIATSELGAELGSALGPVGIILGAALGEFLGSVIGSIFGPGGSVGPNAFASVQYNYNTGAFYNSAYGEDNGGSIATADNLAQAANAEFNGILNAIGGHIVSTDYGWAIGYFAERGIYTQDRFGTQTYFGDAQTAIDYIATNSLNGQTIVGGNPIMEYVLAHSTATSVAGIIAEMNAAYDYSNYLANPLAFDASLALANNAAEYATWQSELAQMQAMGLTNAPNAGNLSNKVLTVTASYVASNLEIINDFITSNDITQIKLMDGGTPTITLTSAQLAQYSSVLSKISVPYVVAVSGSASDITVHTSGTVLTDSAVEVAANIGAVQALVTAGSITSINLSDGGTPTLTLTAAQLADTAALAAIKSPYNIALSDTAANIMANLAAINTVAVNGQLVSISLTDGGTPQLRLTSAELASDIAVFSKLTGSYDLVVSDALNNFNFALNNATLTVNNGSSLTLSGTGDTIIANGVDSITLSGSNTITASSSVLSGSVENLTFAQENIEVMAGSQVTITAADGVLIASNSYNSSTATQDTINWAAGGSQVEILDPASGQANEIENFTGANGTGTNTTDTINYTAGGSQVQQLTGLASGVTGLSDNYSAANGTGTLLETITTYTAGNSQLELFNPASDINTEFQNFAGANGSGTDTSNIINYTAGGSQVQQFTGLPSGVMEEGMIYSGVNGAGILINTMSISGTVLSVSSAYIASDLQALNDYITSGQVTQIILTDTGTPLITLTAAQAAQFVNVLRAINTPYQLALSAVDVVSSGTVNLTTGTVSTIEGVGNTINATASDVIALISTGTNGNVINAVGGDVVDISAVSLTASSKVDSINMSGGTVNGADGSCYNLFGSNNTVVNGNHAVITEFGNNDTITGGAGNVVWTDFGGGYTISEGNGSAVYITGNGTNGSTGGVDTVNTSGSTINFIASNSSVIGADANVTGNNDTINLIANDSVTVNGNGDVINAVSGDTVTIAANCSVTINGSSGLNFSASGGGLNLTATSGDTLVLNSSNGTSEVETIAPSSGVASQIESFSGANGTGTETSNLINYTNATSLVQTFAGLPSGVVIEAESFSGYNGTGAETSNVINYTNGTSQQQLFTGLTSPMTEEINNYSQSNLGGTLTSSDYEYTNSPTLQTSMLGEYTNLPAGIASEFFAYLGPNLMGTLAWEMINYTAGNSKEIVYTGLPGGATSETENFTGTWGAGTLSAVYNYNTSGASLSLVAGTNDIITGADNTINASSSDTVTLNSNGAGENNLTAANGDTVNFSGIGTITQDNINLSSGVVNAAANSQFVLRGANNTVNAANNVVMTVFGNGNVINGGTNDTIWTDFAGGYTVNFGAGGLVGLAGNGPNGSNGGVDSVNMSGGTVQFLNTNGSVAGVDAVVNGNNNTINMLADDTVTVNGTGDVINAVSGDVVTIAANCSVTINGSSGLNFSANGGGLNLTAVAGDTLVLNSSNGTSEVETIAPGSGVASQIESFSGTNGTGTETSNLINYTNATSQVQIFTGLPAGAFSEVENFSNYNGTGTGTSNVIDYTNGTSQVQVFTGLPSGASSEYQTYSGTNGTGTVTNNIINYTNGTSQVQVLTGLPSGASSEYQTYSGTNSTGTETSITLNWTAGGSQVGLLSGLPSGASSEYENYSGANGTGTDTSNVINFTNGTSQQQLFTGLPSPLVEEINTYSQSNLGGTLTTSDYEYTNSPTLKTSMLGEYTNLPAGVGSEFFAYLGPNLTGTLAWEMINYTAGNSQELLFTGLPSGVSSESEYFTGSWGGGTLTSTVYNYNTSSTTLNLSSGMNYSVTGAGNTVNASSSDTITLNSTGTNGNVINAVSSDVINMSAVSLISGSRVDSINMSGGRVNGAAGACYNLFGSNNTAVNSNNVGITEFGNNDTITGGTNNTVWTDFGGGYNITMGSGSTVYLAGNGTSGSTGGGDQVSMSGGTVNFIASSSNVVGAWGEVTGNNNVINGIASDVILANGSGNTVNAVSGDLVGVLGNGQTTVAANFNTVNMSSGTLNTVSNTSANLNGSGNTLNLDTNNNINVYGNNNTVNISSGGNALVSGTGDIINAASGDTITVVAGSSVTINGSGVNIIAAAGDNISINGTAGSNHITGSGSYTLTVNGVSKGTGNNYGTYGFAGSQPAVQDALNPNTDIIVQTDLQNGDTAGATIAESALQQLQQTIASGSKTSQLEGAKWDGKIITWTASADMAAYQGDIQAAFNAWAKATGLSFKEVSNPAQADIDITFSDLNTLTSGVVGYTTYMATGDEMQNATIQIENPNQDPLVNGKNGQQVYSGTSATLIQTLEHEMGHALGFADNNNPKSIMDYYLGSQNQTLSRGDIQAAQSLYGTASTSSETETHYLKLIQAMASFGSDSGIAFSHNMPESYLQATSFVAHPLHAQH